ncbi:hypothetical protein RJJ37_08540 [Rhizobium redzepovicii]|uniref:Cyclic nucleotide-binding domain-containing protein n=1 Tax=Rhizobium redzepovicii TaxID=2867518 RepID=A0AAW8NXT5_9HYPH|nr:hypothetical protein [Rhizobium redzepovicii]MDR9759684.1 hypothetical protein [Rhizobium redzepovicii]MDR9780763.1 hypothetical protein [Rhizobium redzepovicii]
MVLETENTPVSDVYLLEAGLASIVARFPGGRDIEVGIVGREGMTGAAVVLGGFQSANRRGLIEEAHGSGLPRRIPASDRQASGALSGSPALIRPHWFHHLGGRIERKPASVRFRTRS